MAMEHDFSDEEGSLLPVKLSAISRQLLQESRPSNAYTRSWKHQLEPNPASKRRSVQRLKASEQEELFEDGPQAREPSTRRESLAIQNRTSSTGSSTAPRIVKVSGRMLRGHPKRFQMGSSSAHTADEGMPLGQDDHYRSVADNSRACKMSQNNGPEYLTPTENRIPQDPEPPRKLAILDVATNAAGKQIHGKSRRKRNHLSVNNVPYTRLDCVGRGGSCRVYRVMTEDNYLLALKTVNLGKVDASTAKGYRSEIYLLKRLTHVDRVVDLLDWELNNEKQLLSLVMEFGDLDFGLCLKHKINTADAKFDIIFTRHYWREMLECVAAVHAFNIVHSDLKPANFVLVRGRLKIIDFGIANLIGDDTVNVHRDHQVGTPNYMAPEALLDMNSGEGSLGNGDKLIKVGKRSDIWSLGCILYQMTYGMAPFARIPNRLQRAMAIINPRHSVDYPTLGLGDEKIPATLIHTLKKCLSWDQQFRPTAEDRLSSSDTFMFSDNCQKSEPEETLETTMSEKQLGTILKSVVRFCRQTGTPGHDEIRELSKVYFNKLSLTDMNKRM